MTNSKKIKSESKALKLLKKRIPIVGWLPKYTRSDIIADFIAGLTVGLTMMPQSIAYAGLAGQPPQYGLYTAFMGSFAYIFFGTIKEVSIGPTSLMAIITFSYVEGLAIEYVILLTFLAGCVELLLGILKLGFLVDFISPPITSGFTSASAIIIILAQLKPFLGIKITSHGFLDMVVQIFSNLHTTKMPDAVLGVSCVIFLVAMKLLTKIQPQNKKAKKALWFLSISKNALCVFITSAIAMYLHHNGGAPFKLTGPVPQGLPAFHLPSFSTVAGNKTVGFTDMVKTLGSGVVVVPIVAVLANVAIAKSYAADVVVDATQEMMTLGLCNILGSCVQALPSCGAFTRSAVASSSDVRTPLQGLYSASVIVLALSLLTPYFYYIPRASLAAVLITAASSLIDYEILPKLWKTSKFDLVMTVGTFIIGVIFGVEISIVIGVVINMMLLLKLWTRPTIIAEERTIEKGKSYIYIKPELGLYYPAVDYLSESVKKVHNKHPTLPIALDCQNVLRIDYAGAKTVQSLIDTYNNKHVKLVLLNVSPETLDILKELIDTKNLHLCQSGDEISDETFSTTNGIKKDEVPLLIENEAPVSERKMSLYDNA